MLSIYIEMLLCFCHLGMSSGGLPISSDSEAVWRLFSIATTGMAKEEENGKASFRLCVDLPRCNVCRDVVCGSSNEGMLER